MRHAYVDESIHTRGDFILVALVYAELCMDADVKSLLVEQGLTPDHDEFKSSMPMANNAAARELRSDIRDLLFSRCKLAFAVCAINERRSIMSLVGRLVDELPEAQRAGPTTLHFDEGIALEPLSLPPNWIVEHGCDSRKVAGIQLADYAAHVVATLILSELGLVNKIVATESGYPEPEVELAWELWASIRYAMASEQLLYDEHEDGWSEPMMRPFGLVISDGCSAELLQTIRQRLGGIWLGCIL